MPEGLPLPVRLEIPSDLVFVRPVRKMVEGLLYAQGWEEDDVDDATLIITEIVQNAVEHGSRSDGKESILIDIHMEPEAVDMLVIDPGTGRNPKTALERDVETPPPMDDPRGRGLFLIYRLAGMLERTIAEGGGLRIRARKEISMGEVENS